MEVLEKNELDEPVSQLPTSTEDLERIINTFEFEGLPERGHVILGTARFEALPGDRTRLTTQSVFQSVEDRDGMVQSVMKRGVTEGYERLDEILAKLSIA